MYFIFIGGGTLHTVLAGGSTGATVLAGLIGVTEDCRSGVVVDVDELLSEAMAGDCIVGVATVLREEKVEEVDILALLVDERDEKVDNRVVEMSTVLFEVRAEEMDGCPAEEEESLKAEKVDREKVIKVVGFTLMEGTVDGQPTSKSVR